MNKQPRYSATLINIYLYFRLCLGLLLLALHYSSTSHEVLSAQNPVLFRFGILSYVGLCAATFLFWPAKTLLRSYRHLIVQLCIDLCAMSVLIHAGGGIESGLGYLLLIFVAMASVFLQRQLGLFFAAIASMLLMGESVYLVLLNEGSPATLFSSGILGILIFITTIVFQFFTEKIQKSTLEAEKNAQYAQHLQRLAQAIITRMRTGVIVVDNKGVIELINGAALQMLNLPNHYSHTNKTLADISNLQDVFKQWLDNASPAQPHVQKTPGGVDLRVSFASLELEQNARTVLYLEDHRIMTQQAQSLKLASLGHLTASIAHEIRNPLGAISHASQLLSESSNIAQGDLRLVEIILQHGQRVNQIIEDTLVLSRRKERQPDLIDLTVWLNKFTEEFVLGKTIHIQIDFVSSPLWVRFDPTHLAQIMTNLCENGARYSLEKTGKPEISIYVGQNSNQDTVYMDVIDNGDGIAEDLVSQVFEPFYTTAEKGSGLGLYISNDLCEINQATLSYQKTADNKSCFRIDFSHHKRRT